MDDAKNQLDIVWRALSDPTRRALLDGLRAGPRTTGDLVASIPDMTRFGVMKHLAVLVEAGLVIARKEGRQRWNHLNAVPLKMVFERWVSKYEDQWAGSLIRLKNTAERKHEMPAKIIDKPARIAHVTVQIDIDAPKETVFNAWLDRPDEWFYENEESRELRPTRCERRLGGKFYMALPDGGFNVIAEITMIKPNNKIRLRGDCTMPDAFIANMTVAFEQRGSGTRVIVDHRMAGDFSDDTPAGFEEGWMDGLVKLKALLENA